MYYDNVSPVSELKRTKQIYETKLFKVTVPVVSTMSIEEIRAYGVYQSGNKDVDKAMNSNTVNVMITTKAILEYFKQGVTIRLPKPNDVKEIYIVIQNYLNAWRNTLENGINLIEAPTEDLIELDTLAEEVFSRAKWYFNSNETASALSIYFNSVNRTTVNNFFDNSVKNVFNTDVTTINPINDNDNGADRESLSDFFKRKMYSTKFHR